MHASLPFAVNHYLCPAAMDVPQFLGHLRHWGFQGVGLTEAALRLPFPDMVAALHLQGLKVASLNTAGFFLHEGDAGREQDARNLRLLRQAADLGDTRLNVIVGGSSHLPLSVARERAAERLAAYAGQARTAGVQLVLEPLHFLNVRIKSCFNTIAQMESLFAGIPGLLLNADLFHLWWDPDLPRLLRGKSVPLGLLQICDVAFSETDSVPRRVPLGEGMLPWADHMRQARIAFPAIPIELELFADQLPGRALQDILRSSAAALTDFLES